MQHQAYVRMQRDESACVHKYGKKLKRRDSEEVWTKAITKDDRKKMKRIHKFMRRTAGRFITKANSRGIEC